MSNIERLRQARLDQLELKRKVLDTEHLYDIKRATIINAMDGTYPLNRIHDDKELINLRELLNHQQIEHQKNWIECCYYQNLVSAKCNNATADTL